MKAWCFFFKRVYHMELYKTVECLSRGKYTGGTGAEVSLNDTVYRVERFGLFHGGKGTELSITPMDDWVEYYPNRCVQKEPPDLSPHIGF
jgi:hypothetical protein